MAMLIRQMFKTYDFLFFELADKRTSGLLFASSPIPVFLIMISYVWFVTKAGPRFMASRKAFSLDRIIQVYNVGHIIMAIYCVERCITLGWNFTDFNWLCVPVEYGETPRTLEIVNCFHTYFLIKIVDLMDTVFFVLRKRDRQISFLHVYHHTGMVLATWLGTKYFPGGHHTMVGLLNSIVHAVMYSYYLLTSVYPEQKKNIWWKKYITQMQLVQFLLIAVHQGHVLFQPSCVYPRIVSLILVPQNLFLFLLFLDFYRKTYGSRKNRTQGKKLRAGAVA